MPRSLFMSPWLWFALSLGLGGTLSAQAHWLPEEAGPGVPGPLEDAFVIVWRQHPDAVSYQYVLTDNELCFRGCAGDTREGLVQDTFAVEFDLTPGRTYYWTTRMFFSDGDSSTWTVISSFQTFSLPLSDLLSIGQNPIFGRQPTLFIDWGSDQQVQRMELEMRNLQGHSVWRSEPIVQRGLPLRKQELRVDWSALPAANYLLELRGFNGQGQLIRIEPQKLLLR